ncbi:MAG: hypothetical protein J7L22_03850 [Candidatus Marinimicrobia bacterium]|nr:hypothetical protein [Candidatus Neomarinimicrobiota bacterium]RKY60819.1 MAG: hypothetical protein DRP96_04890 [Candidatus Neomarinimicrobiota bacterium]
MANLWNDIKKSLEEFVSKAADKAGEFTREAADKAEEVTKLGKVKLDIFQIKRDIEKQFAELGGILYQLLQDKKTKDLEKNENIKACVAAIKELEKKLKAKEDHYKAIQEIGQKEKVKQSETAPKTEKKNNRKK